MRASATQRPPLARGAARDLCESLGSARACAAQAYRAAGRDSASVTRRRRAQPLDELVEPAQVAALRAAGEPQRLHADGAGALDVVAAAVAHVQHLAGGESEPLQ